MAAALGALASLLGAAPAGAGDCSNPCGLADGGVCTYLFRKGEGFEQGLFRPGDALRLHAGRQRGTCGGLDPLLANQLTVRVAAAAAGPFQPLPVSEDDGRPLWRPEAGVYFLSVAPQQGPERDADRLVVAVDGARLAVRLRVVAPGGVVTVRRTPPDPREALVQGFARRRWPQVYTGEVGRDPLPLQLAPGAYELAWTATRGPEDSAAWVPFVVSAPGDVTVTVPKQTTRFAQPRIDGGGWALALIDAAQGAPGPQGAQIPPPGGAVGHCFRAGGAAFALHSAAAALRVRWFRGTGPCPAREPTGPAAHEETVRAGSRVPALR